MVKLRIFRGVLKVVDFRFSIETIQTILDLTGKMVK